MSELKRSLIIRLISVHFIHFSGSSDSESDPRVYGGAPVATGNPEAGFSDDPAAGRAAAAATAATASTATRERADVRGWPKISTRFGATQGCSGNTITGQLERLPREGQRFSLNLISSFLSSSSAACSII